MTAVGRDHPADQAMTIEADGTTEADGRRREADPDGLRYWPLDRHAWARAAVVWIVMTTTLALLGLLIVHVLEKGSFGNIDRDISEWFRDQRTPTREDVGQVVSGLSDTLAVAPFCLLFLAFAAWRWHRWHDTILVIGALLFEKAIFLPVTLIAGRDRPPIGQLDGNPPSSSFFSGHVAAAVALYFGLLVVVCWHTRSAIVRGIATVLAATAVSAVALSRMLLGMHYLSDVVVGAFVGAVAVWVAYEGIVGTARRRGRPTPSLVDRC